MISYFENLEGLDHLQFVLETEYGFERQVDFSCNSDSDPVTLLPVGDPYLIHDSWPNDLSIPEQEDIDQMIVDHAADWSAHKVSIFVENVRRHIEDRITKEADLNSQISLSAAFNAGMLNASEQTAYQEAVQWAENVKAKGRELAAAGDATFADDSHYPEPTAAARALAAQY